MNVFEESADIVFTLFQKHGVRYLLVGGLAVNYYGVARATGDIDLWIEDTGANRKKLISALKEFGIEGIDALMHIPLIAGYSEILLKGGLYLDLMRELQFIKANEFGASYANATDFRIKKNTIVKIISMQQLIKEKSKSNRAKDKEDARLLKILAEQNKSK